MTWLVVRLLMCLWLCLGVPVWAQDPSPSPVASLVLMDSTQFLVLQHGIEVGEQALVLLSFVGGALVASLVVE